MGNRTVAWASASAACSVQMACKSSVQIQRADATVMFWLGRKLNHYRIRKNSMHSMMIEDTLIILLECRRVCYMRYDIVNS